MCASFNSAMRTKMAEIRSSEFQKFAHLRDLIAGDRNFFFASEIQPSSPGFKEFIVLLLHFEISREICSSVNVLNSLLETRIFYAFRVRNGSKFLYGGWFSTIECSFKWIGAQLLSLLPLNPASEPLGKSSVATFEAYSAQKASQDFMDLWTPYLLTMS